METGYATIELPWKNNEPKVSCIHEGKYELRKRWSQRFGDHFILMNVPGRSFILIHPANDAIRELKGCIAPVSFLTGEGKGLQSKAALRKLSELTDQALLKGNKILLIIQSIKHEADRKTHEQTNA
jgi:hypothetical protein